MVFANMTVEELRKLDEHEIETPSPFFLMRNLMHAEELRELGVARVTYGVMGRSVSLHIYPEKSGNMEKIKEAVRPYVDKYKGETTK
ncbi:MAG: hypothetical protein ABIA12_01970 [Candidatus Aenigmatarchaeota archaeon]